MGLVKGFAESAAGAGASLFGGMFGRPGNGPGNGGSGPGLGVGRLGLRTDRRRQGLTGSGATSVRGRWRNDRHPISCAGAALRPARG